MDRYVTHLEAAIDGTRLDANCLQTLHEGRPLWVRYDLERISTIIDRDEIRRRGDCLFRFRELLPVGNAIEPVSLGEGNSPLIHCPQLGDAFGLNHVWVKDESQLPTGSFKSRGLTMAITMAKHFGVQRVAIPTAGNAGGATAAYAARAGIESFVLMPDDTPWVNQAEAHLHGAHVFLVDGLINDCGALVRQGAEVMQWFDLSTLKEPYRIEGKKTMGLELAEQFDYRLPDVILYPTGGGTGLIGMWKAFHELKQLGWLDSDHFPRMVAVQSDGCEPIARAFRNEERFATPHQGAFTAASGIRVPAAVGDFMILDAVRESEGTALSVAESRLVEWQQMGCRLEGIAFCPETAACIGALEHLAATGWISAHERVVVFNTGAAQKYFSTSALDLPRLDSQAAVDWEQLSTDLAKN